MNFDWEEHEHEKDSIQDKEKVVELYVEDGLHLTGVADSIGVDPDTLRDHLVDEGIGLGTNDVPQDADLGERIDLLREPEDDAVVLRELRERGYDAGDIADDLGVDEGTVEENMRRNQVGSATLFEYSDDEDSEEEDDSIEQKIDELDDPHQDEEVLRHLWEEKGMTDEEMAEKLDVHKTTISSWMRKLDVRGDQQRTEAMMRRWHDDYEVEGFDLDDDYIEERIDDLQHPHQDEEVLRHLWEERGLTEEKIADGLSVTDRTIRKWTFEHDIRDRPSRSEIAKENDFVTHLDSDDDDEGDGFSVPDPEPRTEREKIEAKVEKERHPWRDCEVLTYYWREQGLGCHEIADEIGTQHPTVEEWIDNFSLADENDIARRREETLDNPHQSPIVLQRYVDEGYSVEEVAEALDATVEQVSSRADQYGVEFADAELARFDLPDHVDELKVSTDGDEVVVTAV